MSAKVVLPQRSERQAAQGLSRVSASKRVEILVMQRLDLVTERLTPSVSAVKAYEDLYKTKTASSASKVKALATLFNDDVGNESRRQIRKHKPFLRLNRCLLWFIIM